MTNIVFLDNEEKNNYLKELKKEHNVKVYDENVSEVLDEIEDAEIISCRTKSKFSKEVIDKFSNLKLIATRTVGVDHIELEYCKSKNILVNNVPDYGSDVVAEHVFGLLLAGTRNILKAYKKVKKGEFNFKNLKGYSLNGKVLGVVGTGKIGEEVIKRAKGFGMEIIAFDVAKKEELVKNFDVRYVGLDELYKESDIITLHVPLLEQTKHMIDNESISKMKNGVILINAARGELIKTEELIKNIKKFYFVGLDVLEDENSFSKENKLLKFKNVLITPHIGFYSAESLKKTYEITLENIREFLK